MAGTLELARRFPDVVLPGFGVHPAQISRQSDESIADGLAFVRAHLSAAAVVGEVGLDYLHAVTSSQRERQMEILTEQLRIASGARIPVCLHSRRAERDAWRIASSCMEEWGVPALLHWFTHSAKLVHAACEAPGVYISAGPSVLFSPQAMAAASLIALERLLVETDSPVPFGGEPATPSWIPRVVRAVAAARAMSPEELAAVLDENLDRFLFSSRGFTTHGQGDPRDTPLIA